MGLGGAEYRTAPTPSCYVSLTWGPLVVAVEMDPRAQIIARRLGWPKGDGGRGGCTRSSLFTDMHCGNSSWRGRIR
jgi:hypothetical protein